MAGRNKPERDPFSAGLAMLSRRAHSVAELRRKLEAKFKDDPRIETAITRLRELKFLDDQRFAERTAASLARNRLYGPHRTRRELKASLVNYRYIEPALEQAYAENPARQLLEQALEKKLRILRLPLTRPRFYSLCQSLMRMGFNSDDIMKAVRSRPELKPVAEEVEPADLEGHSEL
jgi:SOS response regulatory protein OraA/RecX